MGCCADSGVTEYGQIMDHLFHRIRNNYGISNPSMTLEYKLQLLMQNGEVLNILRSYMYSRMHGEQKPIACERGAEGAYSATRLA